MRKLGSLEVTLVGLGCNNFGMRIDEERSARRRSRRPRRRHQFLRHRRRLRPDGLGAVPRPALAAPARRSGHRHQVRRAHRRRPESRRRQCPLGRRGGRGQPAPARHRPHRPVPAARARSQRAHRGDAHRRWTGWCATARSARSATPTSRVSRSTRPSRLGAAGPRPVRERAESFQPAAPGAARRTSSRRAFGDGLGVLPYFPLASGLLTGKYRRGAPAPEGTRLSQLPEERAARVMSDRNFDQVDALGPRSRPIEVTRSSSSRSRGWPPSRP